MGTKATRYPDNEFDAAVTPIAELSSDSFGDGHSRTSDGWNVARFVEVGRVDPEGPRSVTRDKEYGLRPKFAKLHHDQVIYRHFANPDGGQGAGPGQTVAGPGVIGPDGVVDVGITGADSAGDERAAGWDVDSNEVAFEISLVSDFHGIHKSQPTWNPSHYNSPNRSGLLVSRQLLEDEDKHFDLPRRYFSRLNDIMVPIATQDIDLDRLTTGATPTGGPRDDVSTPPGGDGVIPPDEFPPVETGVSAAPGAVGSSVAVPDISRPGEPIPSSKAFVPRDGEPLPIGITGGSSGGPGVIGPDGVVPVGVGAGGGGVGDGPPQEAFFATDLKSNQYKEGVWKSHWNITPTDDPVDFDLDQPNEHNDGPGDHGFGPHDYVPGLPDTIKEPAPPVNHFQGGWLYDGNQDVLAQINDIIQIDAIENESAELPRYLNRFKQRVGIASIRHDAHFLKIADDD